MYTVVGGGVAGLVAAARIARADHPVRLFDPADAVGGHARTYDTAGDPVERFPGYVGRPDGPIREVTAAHDVDDCLVERSGRTARYLDGVVHPVDAPWERLAYPGLGPRNALRLRRLRRALPAANDDGDGSPDPAGIEDRTVESIVTEHAGTELYAGWFEPLLRAAFGDRAPDVPAVWLREHVERRGDHGRNGETVGYLEGSAGVLVDALVEAIGIDAVRPTSRIVDIDSSSADRAPSPSATVETDSGVRHVESDGIVLATDPIDLTRLVGVDPGVDPVAGICALVTAEESLTDAWRLVLDDDDAPFDVVIEHTNLVSPRRYGGDHLLYLVGHGGSGPSHGHHAGRSGDGQQRRDRWLDAFSNRFPAFPRESIRSFRIERDPAAATVPASGVPRSRTVPVDLAGIGVPGVAYAGPGCGADRFGTSMAARIAAGVAAAEAVLPEPSRR